MGVGLVLNLVEEAGVVLNLVELEEEAGVVLNLVELEEEAGQVLSLVELGEEAGLVVMQINQKANLVQHLAWILRMEMRSLLHVMLQKLEMMK